MSLSLSLSLFLYFFFSFDCDEKSAVTQDDAGDDDRGDDASGVDRPDGIVGRKRHHDDDPD